MAEHIRSRLEETKSRLQELQKTLVDLMAEVSRESVEARALIAKSVEGVEGEINHSLETVEHLRDETRLQAHLAVLEAEDRWHKIHEHLQILTRQLREKSQPALDEAALQAHLASLETKEVVQQNRERWARKFGEMSAAVEEASLKAATEIRDHCASLIDSLPR